MEQFGRNGRLNRIHEKHSPGAIIEPELAKGEKLIWAGFPVSMVQHAVQNVSQFLFGIPFSAIALSFMWQASSGLRDGLWDQASYIEYLLPFFGIPFLLGGVGMLLSPLWAALKARRTTYALTDRRLIIFERFLKTSVKSWPLDKLKPLSRSGSSEGPGSIYFSEEVKANSDNVTVKKVGFIGISHPKLLEDKIRHYRDLLSKT